jgi:hypothetical protein
MNIDDIYAAYDAQNTASADLARLNEERAVADTLRGSNFAQENTVGGAGSYLAAVADAVNRTRGKIKQRDINPQIADARNRQALGKTMEQRYGAEMEAEKIRREKEQQDLARGDRLAARSTIDVVHKSTNAPAILTSDGRGNFYDGEGKLVNIDDYALRQKASGLSASGLNRGLREFGKELREAQPFVNTVKRINELVTPYGIGGEKEGQEVPGIGVIIGSRGPVGQFARFVKGTPIGDELFSLVTDLSSIKLRENAGTAQTLVETRTVLAGLGLDGVNDPAVFLKHWPEIVTAIQNDLRTLAASTDPEIVGIYEDNARVFNAPLEYRNNITPVRFNPPEEGSSGLTRTFENLTKPKNKSGKSAKEETTETPQEEETFTFDDEKK